MVESIRPGKMYDMYISISIVIVTTIREVIENEVF